MVAETVVLDLGNNNNRKTYKPQMVACLLGLFFFSIFLWLIICCKVVVIVNVDLCGQNNNIEIVVVSHIMRQENYEVDE